jgi:hypothetical protein
LIGLPAWLADWSRWRAVWPLLALVGATTLLALAGLVLAVGLLRGDAEPWRHGADAYPVGQPIPTSFGTLVVRDVEKVAGLTAQDLSGVTHGIQNLVPPDKMQVEAAILLTNRLDRPVDYSLVEQFQLVNESGQSIERLPGVTSQPVRLPPHSSITASMRFMAPRDGGHLWLAFHDPGRGPPLLVDIGATDETPPGALDGYRGHHKPAE